MLFGYTSVSFPGRSCSSKSISLSPGLEEIVVSSVLLGSLGGALAGGSLADRLGRRRLLVGTVIVFGLGAVGAALAPDTSWLIAARVVAGAAIVVPETKGKSLEEIEARWRPAKRPSAS